MTKSTNQAQLAGNQQGATYKWAPVYTHIHTGAQICPITPTVTDTDNFCVIATIAKDTLGWMQTGQPFQWTGDTGYIE